MTWSTKFYQATPSWICSNAIIVVEVCDKSIGKYEAYLHVVLLGSEGRVVNSAPCSVPDFGADEDPIALVHEICGQHVCRWLQEWVTTRSSKGAVEVIQPDVSIRETTWHALVSVRLYDRGPSLLDELQESLHDEAVKLYVRLLGGLSPVAPEWEAVD